MATASPFGSIDLAEGEFERRRTAAKRSGSPAWLWPEVPVADWRKAMADLAQATSAILGGGTGRLAERGPLALSLACYTSGLGPLLGFWFEKGVLSTKADVSLVLVTHLAHGRSRATRALSQSQAIVGRLVDKSIPVVVLKGGHTALSYFPEAATRPTADLDLLVPRSQERWAKSELATAGFRCTGGTIRESTWIPEDSPCEPRSIWLAHADDTWSVDLHNSLDFTAGPGARHVRFDRADPFLNAVPWEENASGRALRQPLQLLHLAVHAGGGLHSLTLLRIVELILVIRRDTERGALSWDEFLRLGMLCDGLGAAYPALAMSEKLVGGTVPPSVLQRCRDAAPIAVRAIVDRLEPAFAQRLDRTSIAEHFMWVSGISGWVRQLGSDLVPRHSMRNIYEARAYRLLRGTITR